MKTIKTLPNILINNASLCLKMGLFLVLINVISSNLNAQCGAAGQRPCNAWERVPSCNSGLIEKNGKCALKTPCGAEGQRACPVWERSSSCNSGLIEKNGKCTLKTPCGAEGQRACPVWERVPSCNSGLVEKNGKCAQKTPCGSEGQRACPVWERVPSCNTGLIEKNGKCALKSPCGGEGQRACPVWERVPSCNSGLVEKGGKCLKKDPCGGVGQRPCLVTERVPSCNSGLVEDVISNKCIRKSKPTKGEIDKARAFINKASDAIKPMETSIKDLHSRAQKLIASGRFKTLFDANKFNEIGRLLNIDQFSRDVRATQSGNGQTVLVQDVPQPHSGFDDFVLKSFSIGQTADGSMILGGVFEFGIVFNLGNASHAAALGYKTYGYKGGVAAGVSGGVSISFWGMEAEELCGNGQNLSAGAGYIGGLAMGIWWPPFEEWPLYRYNNRDYLPIFGFSIVPSLGLEVDISTSRTVTMVNSWLGNGPKQCSDCGGRGQRPCTVLESSILESRCKSGLTEKWGKCVKSTDTVDDIQKLLGLFSQQR
ncbi:MAG: hypothetical protein H6576_08815 [Lewinellaceae bacterium]|nr:hypothetical protein [Saprospiraceae bacterium]MCB9343785.1 hypothetical protein [Lewinellaceae bacterium]